MYPKAVESENFKQEFTGENYVIIFKSLCAGIDALQYF